LFPSPYINVEKRTLIVDDLDDLVFGVIWVVERRRQWRWWWTKYEWYGRIRHVKERCWTGSWLM
jgi:hypothetical protein